MIILITGATSGLGRLTAKKCLISGHTVIITGRSEEKVKDAKEWILKNDTSYEDNLYGLVFDLEHLDSIPPAIEMLHTFKLPAVDVVVHNAGGTRTQFTQVNGCIETTVFMNAVAPLYLNRLLMPFLENSTYPGKRILFVSSSLHDNKVKGDGREETRLPDDVTLQDVAGSEQTWNSMKYYKVSKLAVEWDVYALSERTNVPVIAFCPGFVPGTELIRNSSFLMRLILKYVVSHFSFTTTEEDSTDDYVYYITEPNLQTAAYYQKRELSTPSADALNKSKQEAYWKLANQTIDTLTEGQ